MPQLEYTGSVFQTIYSSQTVEKNNQDIDLNFIDQQINNWSGATPVPGFLKGITLKNLLQNSFLSITYQLNVQIKGSQEFNVGSQPRTVANIIYSDIGNNKFYDAGSCTGSVPGTCIYDVNDTFNFPSHP